MLKSTLLPFQADGVEMIERFRGRCILGDSMGLGKTVQYLAYLDRHPELRPAVIVTEASLKENTRRECVKHVGMDAVVVSGTNAPTAGTYSEPLTIINYDILRDWWPTLKFMHPKLVIFDESQALRDPRSQRTKAARMMVKDVPKLIFASGTPIENRPFEFWAMLNMLDADLWGSAHQFGHAYCGARRNPFSGGWEFKGATRTEELYAKLRKNCLIRRRKEEVLEDLPPVQRSVVRVTLSPKARKEYREAELDVVAWLKKNYSPEAAERAERTDAMQHVNVLKQLAARLKTPEVIKWQQTFLESGEKLMMFGWHTRVVEELAASVRGSALVHGGVLATQRQGRFDAFNNDPSCSLFVGNIQAAGKGWSCTSCSNVAFAEFAWAPGPHQQCIDRCQGLYRGQKGIPTSAFFLVADETIDVKVCKAVQAKSRNVAMVLDGAVTDSGFDVFDLVCEMLMTGGNE